MRTQNSKYRYLLSNLGKGLIWLVLILALFLIAKYYFQSGYDTVMQHLSDKPLLVFSAFTLSEVLFGIIPPELFMIWSLHQGGVIHYILFTILLAGISYTAGIIGYFFGRFFSTTPLYNKLLTKAGPQLKRQVKRFGGFMIVIAAATPVPYSAICMIVGAAHFKLSHFLLFGISRLLRFGVYAYVVWQVDKI
ncbi:YqaA family protein [Reichenbachiella sp. MSK19-1]|uniref:YqaA family protein n=1 Tax=Reichenbachiella sp. MSK19-1 TaxID=1897631 RepID=UPI000E6BEDD9|nr:VTT domain-containing protein [Reichenbachiella sp. MSK19-1]RJE70518.1 hypothetical protein BGP76_10550 [Reichenbachiella sp. MSK19-1]